MPKSPIFGTTYLHPRYRVHITNLCNHMPFLGQSVLKSISQACQITQMTHCHRNIHVPLQNQTEVCYSPQIYSPNSQSSLAWVQITTRARENKYPPSSHLLSFFLSFHHRSLNSFWAFMGKASWTSPLQHTLYLGSLWSLVWSIGPFVFFPPFLLPTRARRKVGGGVPPTG